MKQKKDASAVCVIFGAKGDLTRRKLIPALYHLFINQHLSDTFRIFCIDYISIERETFLEELLSGVVEFSRTGPPDINQWKTFTSRITYISGDFLKEDTYLELKTVLDTVDLQNKKRGIRIFYYAVAPRFIEIISDSLYRFKLANQDNLDRIIIEKPFGTDLETAKKLNRFLRKRFTEKQLYRIDHYLGKETVQNIMAFRFANYVFEPLWNNKYIDHVEITVAEKVTVGSRGGYYDGSGALRDMVQNHLLQLLCITAMECPAKYEAETIRNAKTAVIKQVRPFTPSTVSKNVVRGQYRGYRKEEHVPSRSYTETFVAARLYIDNPRWKGVPFFLRTGKGMQRQSTVIIIQFKDSPNKIFKGDVIPNRLTISIQPELEISLLFESKVPGLQMKLKPVEMDFTYKESHEEEIPEAYEALILDVLKGDATLFMRGDQVEAAWKLVMPILDYWKKHQGKDLRFYEQSSWGPRAATELIKPYSTDWNHLPG